MREMGTNTRLFFTVNVSGKTPLDLAREEDHSETADLVSDINMSFNPYMSCQ